MGFIFWTKSKSIVSRKFYFSFTSEFFRRTFCNRPPGRPPPWTVSTTPPGTNKPTARQKRTVARSRHRKSFALNNRSQSGVKRLIGNMEVTLFNVRAVKKVCRCQVEFFAEEETDHTYAWRVIQLPSGRNSIVAKRMFPTPTESPSSNIGASRGRISVSLAVHFPR